MSPPAAPLVVPTESTTLPAEPPVAMPLDRVTPPDAVALGGEPLLLQSVLATRYNVSRARMVLYTGSRITNHNLQSVLLFAAQARLT